MDAFDFDDDNEVSTGQGCRKSSMTASDECSVTSSIRQGIQRGKLKYHRLNHTIPSMKRPASAGSRSDFGKEGEGEESIGQEQISQSDVSVSSVNSMHRALDTLDGSSPKRPRRRKKLKPFVENKMKTQLSHEYFSSSSPLDFSAQSSASSSQARRPPSESSIMTGKEGENNINGGEYHQLEILSGDGDGYGTPPGSPPRRRRMKFSKGISSVCANSEVPASPTQKHARSTDCSSLSSVLTKLDHTPHAEESSMFETIPSQKSVCSGEYSVASEGTRQSNRSYGTRTSSHRRVSHWKSSQSSQSNASIMSNGSERVATGAGTDVYAMQDAGSSRLILDECNYVCNSFFSGVKEGDGSSDVVPSQHSVITADAACDLANLLALKSSRSLLLKTACSDLNAININKEMKTTADSSIVESILSVFGHVPSSIRGSYLPAYHTWNENGAINQEEIHLLEWDKLMSQNKKEMKIHTEGKQSSMVIPRTKSARNSSRAEKPYSELERSEIDSVVTDALSIAAFFITLDCTFDKLSASAASNHSSAKIFQRKLLKDRTFVSGVAKLLLTDILVTSVLESISPKQSLDLNSNDGDGKGLQQQNDDNGDINMDVHKRIIVDPTSRGRKKKRRRLDGKISNNLEPIQEDMSTSANQHDENCDAPCFDFLSDDTSQRTTSSQDKSKLPSWLKQKLHNAYSRIAKDLGAEEKSNAETCRFCSCFTEYADGPGRRDTNPGKLVLDALHMLINGKRNDNDDDNDDAVNDQEEINEKNDEYLDDINIYSEDKMKCIEEDIVEKDNLHNPMIFKNFMIRRSGAIPYITRATAEALEASIVINMHIEEQDASCCDGCCEYLKNRVLRLLSLLDGLCCISRKNREFMCLIGKKDRKQTYPLLIPSLLRASLFCSRSQSNNSNSKFADIGLASLRTFTNLTHENESASSQVSNLGVNLEKILNLEPTKGVEIILNLLYNLIECPNGKNHTQNSHAYDGIIFCLNSLTNLLETASYQVVCKLIMQTAIASNDQSKKFVDALPWISRWTVDQTAPFRDAVMSGISGESCSDENKRDLKHEEDEFLITAGNGFILLACLLGVHKNATFCESDTTSKIRSIIFGSIPKHENLLLLMINTLKAFCNYYRYSVGDLSVAVITPVLHLITGLERMSDR